MATITNDITSKILKFNELSVRNENPTRFMKKLYKEIREHCLTEAYFSKYIKSKVTEEDLPDFIIYLDEKLPGIIKAFDPNKESSFQTLYRKSLDYRAKNYLDSRRRKNKKEAVYMKYFIPFEEENDRNRIQDPYDDVIERVTEESLRRSKMNNISTKPTNNNLTRLKNLLAKKGAMRKNFFIFLASELPFLSMDQIEMICKELNYDLSETKALEKHLSKTTETTDRSIRNANEIVNKFRSMVLMSEAELYVNNDNCTQQERERIQKTLDYQRSKRNAAMERLESTSTSVKNPVLAKVLDIPLGTVSSSITKAKCMLSALVEEEQENSEPDSVCEKPATLNLFKPSEVFNLEI